MDFTKRCCLVKFVRSGLLKVIPYDVLRPPSLRADGSLVRSTLIQGQKMFVTLLFTGDWNDCCNKLDEFISTAEEKSHSPKNATHDLNDCSDNLNKIMSASEKETPSPETGTLDMNDCQDNLNKIMSASEKEAPSPETGTLDMNDCQDNLDRIMSASEKGTLSPETGSLDVNDCSDNLDQTVDASEEETPFPKTGTLDMNDCQDNLDGIMSASEKGTLSPETGSLDVNDCSDNLDQIVNALEEETTSPETGTLDMNDWQDNLDRIMSASEKGTLSPETGSLDVNNYCSDNLDKIVNALEEETPSPETGTLDMNDWQDNLDRIMSASEKGTLSPETGSLDVNNYCSDNLDKIVNALEEETPSPKTGTLDVSDRREKLDKIVSAQEEELPFSKPGTLEAPPLSRLHMKQLLQQGTSCLLIIVRAKHLVMGPTVGLGLFCGHFGLMKPNACGIKKGSKRRTKHCCKFCGMVLENFVRHLKRAHMQEAEVLELSKLGVEKETRSKRRQLLKKLKYDGDARYNIDHTDAPLVVRRASNQLPRDQCPSCKGFFSEKNIVVHLRGCGDRIPEYITAREIRREQKKRRWQYNESMCETMKMEILPRLSSDEVSAQISADPGIVLYGNKLCERYAGENQEKTIRNKLRIVGRVAVEAKKMEPSVKSLVDLFCPRGYSTFVEAIKKICGYGKAEGREFSHPSAPHQYGPKVREVAQYVIEQSLSKVDNHRKDDEDQKVLTCQLLDVRSWLDMYDLTFDRQIASTGRRQADRRHFDRRNMVPTMRDVQLLLEHIQCKTNEAYMNLMENGFCSDVYGTLAKGLLLKMWTFNRRRVGEVDKLRLNNWLEAKSIDERSDHFKALSEQEQLCASSFLRLTLVGKLRRPIALLVPKADIPKINYLIEHRKQAGILDDNKFLFAKRDTHIEGTATMAQFAKDSGAEQPHLLTGTGLRKHLAAGLRFLNLDDEDLRLMSEAMGHSEKTHLLHYRKNDPALHAGRASKILMALEEGNIDQYKGKSLSDIDNSIVIEENPLEEINFLDCDSPTLLEMASFDVSVQPTPMCVTPKKTRRRIISSSSDSSDDSDHRSFSEPITPSRNTTVTRKKGSWLTPDKRVLLETFPEAFHPPFNVPSRKAVSSLMYSHPSLRRRNLNNTMAWVYAEVKRRKRIEI